MLKNPPQKQANRVRKRDLGNVTGPQRGSASPETVPSPPAIPHPYYIYSAPTTPLSVPPSVPAPQRST